MESSTNSSTNLLNELRQKEKQYTLEHNTRMLYMTLVGKYTNNLNIIQAKQYQQQAIQAKQQAKQAQQQAQRAQRAQRAKLANPQTKQQSKPGAIKPGASFRESSNDQLSIKKTPKKEMRRGRRGRMGRMGWMGGPILTANQIRTIRNAQALGLLDINNSKPLTITDYRRAVESDGRDRSNASFV